MVVSPYGVSWSYLAYMSLLVVTILSSPSRPSGSFLYRSCRYAIPPYPWLVTVLLVFMMMNDLLV